jgi:hypothetical protein
MADIYFGLENLNFVGSKMEEANPIPICGTEFEIESSRQKRKKYSVLFLSVRDGSM